jgi:hypothetical protein
MEVAMTNAAGITEHAKSRLKNRAIPVAVLDLLDEFGTSIRCCGAERMIFDKAARRRMERGLSPEGRRKAERWLNVYAVVSEGVVVTVARKLRRHWRE